MRSLVSRPPTMASGPAGTQIQSSRRQASGYLPIEDYGLIGNMHTCALVSIDGSVDFMCWQVFPCSVNPEAPKILN